MSVNKVNSDGSLLRVAGGTLYADLAVGSIVPFGGSTAPSGFLFCNGAEVLKTAYAELYAVIGDAFGTASSNTKFKLPDLRETAPVGVGKNTTKTIEEHDVYALGEFKDDQLQNHKHTTTSSGSMSQIYSSGAGHMGSGNVLTATGQWDSTAENQFTFTKSISVSGTSGNPTADRHGAVTRGKRLGVNYIIKAKQVAVPADFKDAIDDAISEKSMPTTVTRMSPIAGGFAIFNLPAKAKSARIILLDKYGAPAIAGSCPLVISAGFTSETDSMWYASITDINTTFGGAALANGDAVSVKIEITY